MGYAELAAVWSVQWLFWLTAPLLLVAMMRWSYQTYRDLFNPVIVLSLAVFLRIGVPLVLTQLYEPPALLAGIPITPVHWQRGGVLAFMAALSTMVGWLATPGLILQMSRGAASYTAKRFILDGRAAATAGLFVCLGIAFYWTFLRLNYASPLAALAGGTVRDQLSRVAGTSRYNFIATGLLTYGSVMLSAYLLLVKKRAWMVGLLPTFLATIVLSANGGRIGALAPTVYGAVLLWYRIPNRRIKLVRTLSTSVVVAVMLVVYISFITAYRKGGGIAAGSGALGVDAMAQYIRFSVWYEIGAIYPYALATYFEPGVMHGAITPLMGGFVSAILGLQGTRTGVFLISSFIEFSGRQWGIHTGLPVDMYVNFGVAATIVGAGMFGGIIHSLYSAMRSREANAGIVALYVVGFWHLLWVYYEHVISALDILVLVVPFLWLLWIVSRLTPAAGRRTAVKARRRHPHGRSIA